MGINLIGYFNYGFGIAKMVIYFSEMLKSKGIPFTSYNIPANSHAVVRKTVIDYDSKCLNGNLNIFFTVEIDILLEYSKNFIRNENTLYYLYYVHEIKGQMYYFQNVFPHFDSIITMSKFVREHLLEIIPNVEICQYVSENTYINTDETTKSKYIQQIPKEKIKCFFVFDAYSCFFRKNLEGYISLVQKMQNNDKYFFVLKIANFGNKFMNLINPIKNNKNFLLITEFLSDEHYNNILEYIDVYISLHRSEGFGYTIYEATQKNKFVFCTNFSAPGEFLEKYSKFVCVSHTLIDDVKNKFPTSPYNKYSGIWSEPNIDDCVEKLINLDMSSSSILNDNILLHIDDSLNQKLLKYI